MTFKTPALAVPVAVAVAAFAGAAPLPTGADATTAIEVPHLFDGASGRLADPGVDAETGGLEAGNAADVVAVPGNVLDHIAAIDHRTLAMARGAVLVPRP